MATRQQVVELARSYVDCKYRHQGRTREGIDCAGLIVLVGNELGLISYDTDGYMRRSTGREIFQYFRDSGMDQITPTAIRPGDVILTRDSIFPCHSAIVASMGKSPSIVHAYARRRKVVEERMTEDWVTRTVGAFRFRGLED